MVAVVPVFQYSNIYRPTPKLSQLAKCKEMQQRCIEQCTKISCAENMPRPKAKVRDCFRIFSSMAHGATFGELCVRFNPAVLNINERQLVLFGMLEGLIRRVDKYPITVQRNVFYDQPLPLSATNSSKSHSNYGSQPLLRMHKTSEKNTNISKHQISFSVQEGTYQLKNQSYHYYNGLRSYDEICSKRETSCQQLDSQLSKDRHVIVLLR